MSTSRVSRDTVSSAVASLVKWMHDRSAASKPQLLLDNRDDFMVLLLALRRVPSKDRTNPFFLPIPHSLFPFSDPTLGPSVFLIIDDRAPDSPPPSKFLEGAKESNLPISEVIGISTLRTDYKPFESRRKLCGSHDLFLADKKTLPMLSRLLGKTFFEKKKNALPVNFSRVGWKDQIKWILNSTFFYLRSGKCCAIRVGRLSMEVDQIVDNVMSVVDEAVEKIPKKWGNVRSLHLKAVDSVALPIYQAVPEIGLKIEVGEKEDSGVEEVIDGDEVVEQKSEKKKKKKEGGIRYTNGDALESDSTTPFKTTQSKILFGPHEIDVTVTTDPLIADQWIGDTRAAHHTTDGKQIVVGLDCEWKPNRYWRQNNKIALLQLCIGNRCLILQLKYMNPLPDSVKAFLLDETITFVGVGVGEDLAKLKGNYGLECNKSMDLKPVCNAFLGIERTMCKGLKVYAREILGFELQKSKNATLSNWEEWNLKESQIRYACLDAFVSYLLGCKVLEGKSD